MDQSVLQNPAPNVVALVRMCGKLFVVRRRGGRVRVEPAPRREHGPRTGTGVVVPFPALRR